MPDPTQRLMSSLEMFKNALLDRMAYTNPAAPDASLSPGMMNRLWLSLIDCILEQQKQITKLQSDVTQLTIERLWNAKMQKERDVRLPADHDDHDGHPGLLFLMDLERARRVADMTEPITNSMGGVSDPADGPVE